MTPIPAKVLAVDKQSHQYHVLVQLDIEKYLGPFHALRFAGISRPFRGKCHSGQLDLFYDRNPGFKEGESFPLWTLQ
jgi:hypothetical protein